MYKFFVPETQKNKNEISIKGLDVNHISNVLRLKPEENLLITIKETEESFIAKIKQITKERVLCDIIEKIQNTVESNVIIDLFQGLPKFDKMEYIIQKSTELGVRKIIPIEMERCVVKLDQNQKDKKIERWKKIAEVAAKQSKRDIIPEIEDIKKVEEICNNTQKYDIILLAYENENKITLKQELKKINKKENLKIGIIIGPEGGLSEKEVSTFEQRGIKSVSLGKRTLRTETAPIVMISDIIYEFEL